MNKVTYKFYQEMSQLSVVKESDDHETFNNDESLEKLFKDLEYEHFKREWIKKYGCELEG